jgi:hypothetical protein
MNINYSVLYEINYRVIKIQEQDEERSLSPQKPRNSEESPTVPGAPPGFNGYC